MGSGDNMECGGLNTGQQHTRQVSYPLVVLEDVKRKFRPKAANGISSVSTEVKDLNNLIH